MSNARSAWGNVSISPTRNSALGGHRFFAMSISAGAAAESSDAGSSRASELTPPVGRVAGGTLTCALDHLFDHRFPKFARAHPINDQLPLIYHLRKVI